MYKDIAKPITRSRISRDQMFTEILKIVAQRSTCLRSQVAALIVKDGRIISMGYNGPVSGMPICEDYPEKLKDIVKGWQPETRQWWYKEHPHLCEGPGCTRSLHAETNAIAFAARAGVSVEGCTMYCSLSPCINCAKVIVNSGIRKLIYLEEYRDLSGIELLKRSGIEVEYLMEFK